jgi:hypothetical protein
MDECNCQTMRRSVFRSPSRLGGNTGAFGRKKESVIRKNNVMHPCCGSLLVVVFLALGLLSENPVESLVAGSTHSNAFVALASTRSRKILREATSLTATGRRGREGVSGMGNEDDDDVYDATDYIAKIGRRIVRSSAPPVKNGVRRGRGIKNRSSPRNLVDVKGNNKSEEQPIAPKLTVKEKARKGKRSSSYFAAYDLLSHELLTKAEEQRLGRQLQKAILLTRKIEDVVDARNLRRIEIERDEEDSIHGGWDETDDDDDDFSLSSILRDGLDDFLMETRAPTNGNLEFSDDDSLDDGISDEALANLSIVHGIDPRRSLEYFDANSFSSLDSTERVSSDLIDHVGGIFATDQMRSLTDHEIVNELGIAGGRSELHDILIEGANARERLIRSNMKLVVSIAKKWFRRRIGSSTTPLSLSRLYGGSWTTPSKCSSD